MPFLIDLSIIGTSLSAIETLLTLTSEDRYAFVYDDPYGHKKM
ncbi:MAG: hypothetical protein RQ739_04380 [Desulfotignum sp.]|nr:hypothetical protein [Desulfotignum sp.]